MTKYEKLIEEDQNADKVVYYDYLLYKRASGWFTGLINSDWHRPEVIKKAKYSPELLQKMPEYYFLGFPIKELLKHSYSNGYCHACAVALSLYFEDFTLITCNLKYYEDHYYSKSGKEGAYEHTFLTFNHEDGQRVIDTTFGFITDLETYSKIFEPNNIRIITSAEIDKTEPYQFIKSLKEYSGPPLGLNEVLNKETGKWEPIPVEVEYRKILNDYMELCKNFVDPKNPHLTDFINRCLYRTSNSSSHWNWRNSLEFKEVGNGRYEYPKRNLSSLEDDEFDNNLYSVYEKTIARNEQVLLGYHNVEKNAPLKELQSTPYERKTVKKEVLNLDEETPSPKKTSKNNKILTFLKRITRY